MSLLKSNNRKEKFKLVGVYVPLQVSYFLTLFTLSRGVSKSKVLQDLLENWKQKMEEDHPEKELIKDIIQRANMQWRGKKATGLNMSFNQFKDKIKYELTTAGLTESHVSRILNGLIDYEKNEKTAVK